jgi:cytochrome c peroxidase
MRVHTKLSALMMLATPTFACGEAQPDVDFRAAQVEDIPGEGLVNLVRGLAAEHGVTPIEPAPEIRSELVELGQALAFDKILSGNKDVSCLTCHHPQHATIDDLSLSIGVGGAGLGPDRVHPDNVFIPRNAPPLFNLHAMDTMFWDGRVNAHGGVLTTPRVPLEEKVTPEMEAVFEFGVVSAQAMFPVTSRAEMRGLPGQNELGDIPDNELPLLWEALMERLGEVPMYRAMFEAAYPGTQFDDMSFAHAANALAAFQIAAFAATDTPWDRFLAGDDHALTFEQRQGAKEFFQSGCADCHSGPSFTDESFHNTALAQIGPGKGDGQFVNDDLGRSRETNNPADNYKFRTPPLRNVEITGPWGHAGQIVDLRDFVDHYIDPAQKLLDYDVTQVDPRLHDSLVDNFGLILANLSPLMETMNLDPQKVDQVVAFMKALTDEASLDLESVTPASVPSGLPIEEVSEPVNPPLVGSLHLDNLGFDTSCCREMIVWEPSMCEGHASAAIHFDEPNNKVTLEANFAGLPYRPTHCYEFNPTTNYNEYPDCVEEGRWQIWFVLRTFSLTSTFWYDFATGELIGHEHDVTNSGIPLPETAFPVEMPVGHMIETELFESDPETLEAHVSWDYDYDHMLDATGTGGVYFAVLPFNIFDPTNIDIYYTNGGLSPEQAPNFGDTMHDMLEGRGGIMIVTSLEPDPKPDYLRARDNIMLGWGGTWPGEMVPPIEDSAPVECGTPFQWPDFYLPIDL